MSFLSKLFGHSTDSNREKYPITVFSKEYCKLMPDVPEEVALKVRDVLVDVSGWDRDEIHPDTRIVEFDLW